MIQVERSLREGSPTDLNTRGEEGGNADRCTLCFFVHIYILKCNYAPLLESEDGSQP